MKYFEPAIILSWTWGTASANVAEFPSMALYVSEYEVN